MVTRTVFQRSVESQSSLHCLEQACVHFSPRPLCSSQELPFASVRSKPAPKRSCLETRRSQHAAFPWRMECPSNPGGRSRPQATGHCRPEGSADTARGETHTGRSPHEEPSGRPALGPFRPADRRPRQPPPGLWPPSDSCGRSGERRPALLRSDLASAAAADSLPVDRADEQRGPKGIAGGRRNDGKRREHSRWRRKATPLPSGSKPVQSA